MAQIRVLRTTDTSNPVGDLVIRRPGRRDDLVAALTARVRRLIGRTRSRVTQV